MLTEWYIVHALSINNCWRRNANYDYVGIVDGRVSMCHSILHNIIVICMFHYYQTVVGNVSEDGNLPSLQFNVSFA